MRPFEQNERSGQEHPTPRKHLVVGQLRSSHSILQGPILTTKSTEMQLRLAWKLVESLELHEITLKITKFSDMFGRFPIFGRRSIRRLDYFGSLSGDSAQPSLLYVICCAAVLRFKTCTRYLVNSMHVLYHTWYQGPCNVISPSFKYRCFLSFKLYILDPRGHGT